MDRNKEKIELLNKLKKEINVLENQLKINRKIFSVKNLKICKEVLKKFSPYIISGALIVCGGSFITKNRPFVFDNVKKYASITTELDSFGNKRETKEYVERLFYVQGDNKLIQYGDFKTNDNVVFERDVKTYNVESMNVGTLEKIMCGNTMEDLNEQIGEPSSIEKEYIYNDKDETLNQKSHIKLILYSFNKKEFIIEKESLGSNIGSSILYSLLLGGSILIIALIQSSFFDIKFCKNVKEILDEYGNKNNIIKEKIKIKKDTYKRLGG